MSEAMTRREFVRIAGTGTALLAVASVTGCESTEQTKADDVQTPSKTFGGNKMSKKILVGYATRTGSTVGVAEAIGRTLSERGFLVEVKPLREHPKVEGYDAVVLGSAINGGSVAARSNELPAVERPLLVPRAVRSLLRPQHERGRR